MAMTEHRFACTACGQCCYGWLPLTVKEAMANAHRFPLAISIVPTRPGTPGQKVAERIGAPTVLPPKRQTLLVITPISFVPPSMRCPELAGDNRCSIHAEKPLRCRTMPFYPYKDEDRQAEMLVPRKGWLCDTSEAVPVVYRDRKIVDRTDFDREEYAIAEEVPKLRRYADLVMKHNPALLGRVSRAVQTPGGRVIVGFVSLLRYDRTVDLVEFAARQRPVLEDWAARTAGDAKLAEHHNYYREAIADLERYG